MFISWTTCSLGSRCRKNYLFSTSTEISQMAFKMVFKQDSLFYPQASAFRSYLKKQHHHLAKLLRPEANPPHQTPLQVLSAISPKYHKSIPSLPSLPLPDDCQSPLNFYSLTTCPNLSAQSSQKELLNPYINLGCGHEKKKARNKRERQVEL